MAIRFLNGQTIDGTLTVSGNVQGATFNSLPIETSQTNNNVNKIVRTTVNGYVNFGWINSVSGNHTGTITRITASNDAYLRYVTPAQFRVGVTDGYYAPVSTVSGVTSISHGNGITATPNPIISTGTLTMSGSYTGNFTVTGGLNVLGSNHFVTFENTSATANHYTQMLLKAGTAHGYIWTANQNSTNWGGANSLNIYTQEAGAIAFYTTSVKRMTIAAAGNVGIGTDGPSGKLDVQGGEVMFSPNTANKDTFLFTTGVADKGFMDIKSDTTVNARINTNGASFLLGGSFGIGTNTPVVTAWGSTDTRQLTIVGSNYGVITLQGSATALTKYSMGVGGTRFYMAYDNVAGVHRMTIGSTGNVGIGTTSPDATLDVHAPSTTAPSLTMGAAAGQIFKNEDSELAFGLMNASPYNVWMQSRFNGNVSRPFVINPLGGNVGIGTDSPFSSAKLDVNGNIYAKATAATIDVVAYNTTSGLANADLHLAVTSSGEGQVRMYGNYPLTFYTSNTERMRIDSSGRTIIQSGTLTTPAYTPAQGYPLHVQGNSNQSYISIGRAGQTTGSQGMIVGIDTTTSYLWNRDNINITFGHDTGGTKMSILYTGEVLIGNTVNNGGDLQVSATNTSGSIRLGGGNGVSNSRVYIQSAGDGSYLDSYGGNAYQKFTIYSSSLILNPGSAGKVIIGDGSTTPGVSYTSLLQLQKGNSTSNEPDIVLKINNLSSATTSGTGGSRIVFEADETGSGNGDGALRHSIESMYFGSVSNWKIRSGNDFDQLCFDTGGSEKMRITSVGFTKAKANGGNYFTGSYHEFVNNNNVSGDRCLVIGNRAGHATNNTSSISFIVADDAADRLYIYGNGNVVNLNNSYGALSDVKLKENIVDATSKLNDLMKVKIRNYNLIGQENKQIGVVAQELEEVFPGLVDESIDFEDKEVTDKEGNISTKKIDLGTTTKSVKYSVFVPMLIKAIQEQQKQIEDLQAQIKNLSNL